MIINVTEEEDEKDNQLQGFQVAPKLLTPPRDMQCQGLLPIQQLDYITVLFTFLKGSVNTLIQGSVSHSETKV